MAASNVVMMQQQPLLMVTPGKWSSGLCDCGDDMGICCYAVCCFPCFTCKTTEELGECSCLPFFCDSPPVPPISLALRYGLRKQYGIQGSLCNDCIAVMFCNMCTWCQMAREIKTRKQAVTVITTQPAVVQAPAATRY